MPQCCEGQDGGGRLLLSCRMRKCLVKSSSIWPILGYLASSALTAACVRAFGLSLSIDRSNEISFRLIWGSGEWKGQGIRRQVLPDNQHQCHANWTAAASWGEGSWWTPTQIFPGEAELERIHLCLKAMQITKSRGSRDSIMSQNEKQKGPSTQPFHGGTNLICAKLHVKWNPSPLDTWFLQNNH